MAQTTILAAQTAAGSSSDFTVTTPVKVSLFATGMPIGKVNERVVCPLFEKDPNGNYQMLKDRVGNIIRCTNREPQQIIAGPGTYRLDKSITNNAVGAYVEAQT